MSVELHPEELGFRRPFDREVTELLRLSNPNQSPIAFKVKTTAPKQYCVRPNSGIIPPQSNVEVQVLLQAMREDPPLDARCRDKFLVQSVAVAVEEQDESNISALWQTMEKTSKSSIQERKIRVQFLPPTAAPANGVTGATAQEDQPPAYRSPSPQRSTRFNTPGPETKAATSTEKTKATAADTAEATGIVGAASAVINAVPTSQEQLQRQLNEAQAQISKLTNQLADPQVRQRKVQEATDKVQTVVQQTSEGGVPLQITAGLCLLSFLIAYFFF